MTREQAQELLANVNGKIEMKRLDAVNLLLREIDELKIMEEDAQQYALKCRKELEALQSRSCDECVHIEDIEKSYRTCRELRIYISHPTESTFCCNRHEPKPLS